MRSWLIGGMSAGLLSAALSTGSFVAAEEKPQDAETRIKAVEALVKELQSKLDAQKQASDAKVKELEAKIESQKQAENARKNRWSERMQDRAGELKDQAGGRIDEMMDKMRREMEKAFGDGGAIGGYGGFGGGNDYAAPMRKPRLGVELAPVTDAMNAKYGNKAKEGAYVGTVVPGSPAQKAGITEGDVISQFDNKPVKDPLDLIEEVKGAKAGNHEITLEREGRSIMLTVALGEETATNDTNAPAPKPKRGGWLRNKGLTDNNAGGNQQTQTKVDVKASALEMSDGLAKELSLTDDQRKKMTEVLTKHAGNLTNELTTGINKQNNAGGLNITINGDMSQSVDKHVVEAEKELTGTLNADQIAKWREWRKANNSFSFSQSTSNTNTTINGLPGEDPFKQPLKPGDNTSF